MPESTVDYMYVTVLMGGYLNYAEALLAGRPLPDPPEWLDTFPRWTSKDNLLSEGDDLFVALYDFQVS